MPPGPSFEAVVLDLDDTLIVEEATAHASIRAAAVAGVDPERFRLAVLEEARRRWHQGPHHGLCLELGFASWEGLWATFEGGHPRLEGLRRWAPGYQRATWRSALRSLGVDDEAAADRCADLYVAAQRAGHPLVVGADAVVRGLAEHHRLALLTNGPPDVQRHKIEATGLADCFEVVVVSGEVGAAKPDPAVFSLVLDRLGTEPGSTVMVGDNWARDVLGALGAGWSAVWVSDGRPCPDPGSGVPAVGRVTELPDLLAGWPGRPGAITRT